MACRNPPLRTEDGIYPFLSGRWTSRGEREKSVRKGKRHERRKDDSTENSGGNKGTRRGRRENLKPWPKGVSGNPGGRPRKQQISKEYALRAGMELPESLRLGLKLPKGATYAAALVLGQFRAGIKGNTPAAKEIADRVDGRVPLPMELETPEGKEIRIKIVRLGGARS